MNSSDDPATLLSSPNWLPSHWLRSADGIQFVRLERREHEQLTFLSDEYLQPLRPQTATLALSDLEAAALPAAPAPQYIFHSAFAASTLLTRALDAPAIATALKEPQILNELAEGVRTQALSRELLTFVVKLLARPYEAGEKVVIKPSNVANILAGPLLDLDPASNAIFLYAPLPRFLRSVADKGLFGRTWVRRLFAILSADTRIDFGLSPSEQFELTDLQVTALAWLRHHAQAAALLGRLGVRVRVLDSEAFLARRAQTMLAVAQHFGLALDEGRAEEIANGPAFTTHSKEIGRQFDPEEPLKPKPAVPVIDDEIRMVADWARSVAEHAGIPIEFPREASLLP
jgi:hypothetical protein